jgi:hypothetical protein
MSPPHFTATHTTVTTLTHSRCRCRHLKSQWKIQIASLLTAEADTRPPAAHPAVSPGGIDAEDYFGRLGKASFLEFQKYQAISLFVDGQVRKSVANSLLLEGTYTRYG